MIVVYVPTKHTEAVRIAMCEAGAGAVGDEHYDHVVFVTRSICKYRVLEKAWDKAGAKGEEYESEENRIEAIYRREKVEAVIRAIVEAHPYETPAITIYPTLVEEYKYWTD